MISRAQQIARVAVLLSLATSLCSAATASVLFTNFDAGFGYDSNNGAAVGSGFDGTLYEHGAAFTAGASGVFRSLDIALSAVSLAAQGGPVPDLVVSLATDSSNHSPWSALESWHLSPDQPPSLGSTSAPLSLTSTLNLNLSAGTSYWVTVNLAGASFSDAVARNWNSVGATNLAGYNDGSGWYAPTDPDYAFTSGAFQVNAITANVLEPETYAMTLAGLGVMGFVARRRRRA